MSKFEYASFYGGYDNFAVSKQKFTKEEAIEIAKKELCYGNPKHTYLAVGNGFVRHRAGINEDGEPQVGIKGEIKKSIINPIGDYVFRIPSRNKIDIFSPQIINSRIHRIQDWVGNQYLTISSLYMSGMITALKNIYEIKGELDFEDYVSVADQFDYGSGNPERYVINLKDQIELYIKEWEINA